MRPRPTFANVTSMLALVIALGGTAYAGVTLGRGAVKNANIATNAVTSSKVKDHSLLARDFKTKELLAAVGGQIKTGSGTTGGTAGVVGTTGPAGVPGGVRAYAVVSSAGALIPTRSRGIVAVTKPAVAPVGSYCIALASTIDVATTAPVANANLVEPATSSKDYAQVDTAGADCGGQLEVIMRHLSIDLTTNPISIAAHRSDEAFTIVVP